MPRCWCGVPVLRSMSANAAIRTQCSRVGQVRSVHPRIDRVRHELHMVDVHAQSDMASVVDRQTLRYRATEGGPDRSMEEDRVHPIAFTPPQLGVPVIARRAVREYTLNRVLDTFGAGSFQ